MILQSYIGVEFASRGAWLTGSLQGERLFHTIAIGGLRPDDGVSKDAGMEPRQHPRDPLHGVTLEKLLEDLVSYYGWEELGRRVRIRCFRHDPSVKSSLVFLRRTPWARAEVETLYRSMLVSRDWDRPPG